MPSKTGKNPSKAKWGSDVVVDLLKAYGIEYVAFNPGSTFRGIEESLVNYGRNSEPEVIECCHEEIAVAIAHGYAKATGKPMVAVLHDVVGTMHASMAIYNAFIDRVPIIILSGTGPMDTTKRRPFIDWIHTAQIQGNLVRDYVKWDDQPANIASLPDSFMRAYKVATTEPKGPVYLCLDVDLQEDELKTAFTVPDVRLYAAPTRIAADPTAIQRVAELLVDSERPVIITDWLGRTPTAVENLIELAELLAIPVIDLMGRFNFPNTHPLDLTGTDVVTNTDLILALDAPYLYQTLTVTDRDTRGSSYIIPESTTIIQMGLDDIGIKSMAINYHKLQYAEMTITADTSIALPQLLSACTRLIEKDPKQKEVYLERFSQLSAVHHEQRVKWREEARKLWDSEPVSLARLASEVWDVIREEDWVLVNGNRRGWVRRLWELTKPYQYLGHSGAAGLGYGMPASLGAALAYRKTDKLCVNLQNDGDLLQTCSSLWTGARHRLPLLIVMNNNQAYGNSVRHRRDVAKSRTRAENLMGTTIDDPLVDFAQMARSFGAYGEGPIEKPEAIRPALERMKKVVKEQRIPALLDVLT